VGVGRAEIDILGSNMSNHQLMTFDEIIPNASVRVAVVDGIQYLSIRDLIMVMCVKNGNDAGQIWRRIPESNKNELQAICLTFKFKGRGQQEQTIIQFQGALKLLMWLPGEKAKSFRSQAAEILTRYYAGDKTLLKDVWENAQSHNPINEAARAALPEIDEYNSKRQKMMEDLQEDLAVIRVASQCTREYVVNLREIVEVKKELYGLETSFEKEKFSFEEKRFSMLKEKILLMEGERNGELEHKKAMKALDSLSLAPAAVPTAASASVEEDPSTYTTVLKVFTRHQGQFPSMTSRAKKDKLLRGAGIKASAEFKKQWGLEPARVGEDGHDVCKYPLQAEDMIMAALRSTMMELRAGGDQVPIRGYLVLTGSE